MNDPISMKLEGGDVEKRPIVENMDEEGGEAGNDEGGELDEEEEEEEKFGETRG